MKSKEKRKDRQILPYPGVGSDTADVSAFSIKREEEEKKSTHTDTIDPNERNSQNRNTDVHSRSCCKCRCFANFTADDWKRYRILLLYLLTSTILFMDLALLAPNLSAAAEEFGFDDDERDVKLGGYIALAFFAVGTPVALLIGWLADFTNRTPLYAITVFIGEAACFATYFTKTYQQLFAMRMLTGISIGGALPVIYSVLGDIFPSTQRNAVAAVITTGTGLGTGMGQLLAGFTGPKYGWRFPFLVVSIPGMAISFVLVCIKDPKRGQKEVARLEIDEALRARGAVEPGDPDEETNDGSNMSRPNAADIKIKDIMHEGPEQEQAKRHVSWKTTTCELLKTPTVVLVWLGAAPGALPFGFGSVFLNDYLAQDRGLGVERATGILATFGIGNMIGVIAGGALGQMTYKRNVRYPPLIMGTSLLLSCVPMYFLVNWVDEEKDMGIVSLLGILTGALSVASVPIERAIMTNVTKPQSRGRAQSVLSVVDELGKGFGPALVSLLIQQFDRPTAFNISLVGWIIGGIISYIICFFVRKDEDKVQSDLRDEIICEEGLSRSIFPGLAAIATFPINTDTNVPAESETEQPQLDA